MTAYLGIDPGLTGALALLDGDDLAVEDVPVFKVGSKTVVDHFSLARIVDNWAPRIGEVWIEFVSASPQMGVTSAFTFGETAGLIRGVCAAHFLKIHLVTPAKWKVSMKARGDKDEARARACEAFPAHGHLFRRKMDHGRAEASLIALYGSRQMIARAA